VNDCRQTGCSHHETCGPVIASNTTNEVVYQCYDSLAADCRTEGCEPGQFCSFYMMRNSTEAFLCLNNTTLPTGPDCE